MAKKNYPEIYKNVSDGIKKMLSNNFKINFKQNLVQQLQNKYPKQNTQQNPEVMPNGEIHVKHMYANDGHGHMYGFRRLKTAVDTFKAQNPEGDVFLSGDEWVGANENKNKAIVCTMNSIKPTAVALGNHNFDCQGAKGLSKLLDFANYKTLALNIKPSDTVKDKNEFSLQDDIDAGRIVSSFIREKNGVKEGFIGLAPIDLMNRINQQCKDNSKDIKILDIEETRKALQAEVDKLEAQGAKIITLISHTGNDAEKLIAQNVSGIDIIHGGHSHHTHKGLTLGENLFVSPRGEYVVLTQAGKNGHLYGELDVTFDKDGKIINAQNEVKPLDVYSDSLLVKLIENAYIGAPKVIGNIAKYIKTKPEDTIGESCLCSFLCDGYKKYTGADIVLNNPGTMRSSLSDGPLNDQTIIDMMPFYNDVYTFKMSEKDIIDVLNGALEATTKFHRTGALQVSGMKYVIGKDNKVKEAYVLKDDGTTIKMNVQNPSADKFYNVAYNSYLMGGPEGVEKLKSQEIIKKHDLTETDILLEYIKSFNNKPIEIKEDGRITVEQ